MNHPLDKTKTPEVIADDFDAQFDLIKGKLDTSGKVEDQTYQAQQDLKDLVRGTLEKSEYHRLVIARIVDRISTLSDNITDVFGPDLPDGNRQKLSTSILHIIQTEQIKRANNPQLMHGILAMANTTETGFLDEDEVAAMIEKNREQLPDAKGPDIIH